MCQAGGNMFYQAHASAISPCTALTDLALGAEPCHDSFPSTMSFTNTPVSRLLVLGVIAGSIAASLLDVKHYFYIIIDTHLWRYRQFWRLLAYQLSYTNSTEVLFAAMSFYNLRVVERMWGSRKYAVSIPDHSIAVGQSPTQSSDVLT